jgi:hypothetical protein
MVLIFILSFSSTLFFIAAFKTYSGKNSVLKDQTICITGQLARLELESKFRYIIVPSLQKGYNVNLILALQVGDNQRVNYFYNFKDSSIYTAFNTNNTSNFNQKTRFWDTIITDLMKSMEITAHLQLTNSNILNIERNIYLSNISSVLYQEYAIDFEHTKSFLRFYPHTYKMDISNFKMIPKEIIKTGDKKRVDPLFNGTVSHFQRYREQLHLVRLYI